MPWDRLRTGDGDDRGELPAVPGVRHSRAHRRRRDTAHHLQAISAALAAAVGAAAGAAAAGVRSGLVLAVLLLAGDVAPDLEEQLRLVNSLERQVAAAETNEQAAATSAASPGKGGGDAGGGLILILVLILTRILTLFHRAQAEGRGASSSV